MAVFELARRTRIPIAGFETETGKYSFAALIDAGAIQVVQPDVVQVGGFSEAAEDCALRAHETPRVHEARSTAPW